MVSIIAEDISRGLLPFICVILCLTSTNEQTASASPVYDCVLYKDTYICTGAQYQLYCNTSQHDFVYSIFRYQTEHQCINSGCNCIGNLNTCTCTSNTSSCFCSINNNSITISPAVSPRYDCVFYNNNNTYICTGVHYRMYCSTSATWFYYTRYQHVCLDHCRCYGDKYNCRCYGYTSSSCSCENNNNNINDMAIVSPVNDCQLLNDTYTCTGAQYRLYCDISQHDFYYATNSIHHHCVNNNCACFGYKTTCYCPQSRNSTCFCTDNVNTITTSTSLRPTTPGTTPMDKCSTPGRLTNLLDQIEKISVQQLPLINVTNFLDLVFNTSEEILHSLSNDLETLAPTGNRVLRVSEKLVSMLVKPTTTFENVSFTLESVEAQVFMVGPRVTLNKIPRLDTTNASVDIDLIGIAKNNLDTSAVAFMSYTTMENLLKAEFFNTSDNTSVKTMMSTVISATLPKTTNKQLTKPVNFTLKHIREFVSGGNMSCVYWNITEWIVDGCSVLHTNSSNTVCSCVHLSTFALIMQTSSRPPEDDPLMEVVNLVAVSVGLVFNSLALLTFAFCRWKPGVNNVARINLCISLLSAHLLFLLTQHFLTHIKPLQVLCNVLSGFLHFLFLSCFVWMFIEAVLLFICVKNLSQISSRQRAVLSSRFLIVIGYVIALVIVGVSVGLFPEGYGSDKCWIKVEKSFIWSFLGPVCVILAINMILFIRIIISLNSTLTKLNTEVSQMKQTKIMVFKTLAQFVVLGCPWILGFFTEDNKMMEILFVILKSQQGTFIFLIYCLLNNEVRQQYVKWIKAFFPGLKTIKSALQRK